MAELFADVPELLVNTVEIAKRCSLEIKLGSSMLPAYPVPAGSHHRGLPARGGASAASRRRLEEAKSLRGVERDAAGLRGAPRPRARRHLQHGLCRLFLDRRRLHPLGPRATACRSVPGRGSGAGSLVAFVLGITDLDPIEHDLLFERFLNPERVSMPDFDVDFCMEGRDRVIEYVANKYGRERVSQIITYGTLAAKAVVRDVGRVLGHNYGYVDKIAKLIPFEIGITLDKALEQEEELRRLYEARCGGPRTDRSGAQRSRAWRATPARTPAAWSSRRRCSPISRRCTAKRAAPRRSRSSTRTTSRRPAWSSSISWACARSPSSIGRCATSTRQRAVAGEPPLVMSALPMDDAATYQLLKSCKTTAVFQLESRGMKDLIRRLQPDRFGDIVALVALFRPGPLQSGMVEDFIARKHDTSGATIDYLHPDLKPVLEATYGVILYQEQVMQIAQILAGYTLGGADLLRRAMGKKKPEEMAKQRSVFVSGAVARGVREAQATHIFDLMEKFAGYGFNKSHSAAYALLSYQTAWLKAHYPAAFMAAVLSSDMDKTDKVVTLIDECASMGLTVQPPDVNESVYAFRVAGPGSIRYGMGAIKGVGESAVQAIIEERARRRPLSQPAGSVPAHRSAARQSARLRGPDPLRQSRSASVRIARRSPRSSIAPCIWANRIRAR